MLTCANSFTSLPQNDTICLPVDTVKELTKLAAKGKLCDSLIQNREEKIEFLELGVNLKNEQILLSEKVINKQKKRIAMSDKKIKNLRLLSIGLGFIAVVEGMILAIVFL